MNSKEIMLSAIKAQLGRIDAIPCECIDEETLKSVYSLSKKHDITHIISTPLEKYCQGQLKSEFVKQKMLAVYRREQLDFEESRISKILEENGIDFILLKGSVIKNYYPEKWMRTSSDIDILIPPDGAEKALKLLTENYGYKYEGKSLHDYQLYSENGVHVELHYGLSGNKKQVDKVLERIWEYSSPTEDNCRRHTVTPEFLIFHTVAHALYHFIDGGCGIKPLIDLWVLENNLDYDKETLRELIKEGGCESFYNSFQGLMKAWFDEGKYTPVTEKMEEYILSGGVYGNREQLGSSEAYRKGGRAKYLINRIFKSREVLEVQYTVLKEKPYLLPYFQIKRWFNLFSAEKRKNVAAELSGSMKSNGISEMMKELGI